MVIHQFNDLDNVPLEFDKETEELLFKEFGKPQYKLLLNNGYLARTLKEKYHESILFDKIEYFHRFIMKDKISELPNKYRKNFQIHHKDGNKLNNKKENLQIIEEKDHFELHEKNKRRGYWKAINTYATKKYGEDWIEQYDEELMKEEFDEWLDNKQQEDYY